MRLNLIAAALLCVAGPAMAQVANAPPPPATPAPNVNLRNFIIRNMSHQAIVDANVLLTNKGQESLTDKKGKIAVNESRSVQTRRDQCPQNITLRFADGRNLASDALTDCNQSIFTVTDYHITPGAF